MQHAAMYLHERLVYVLKALGLLWQLLDNVPTTEDSLHVHPHALNHEPLLHNLTDSRQLGDPAIDIFSERSTVAVAGHATQSHLTVLQLLNQLCCLAGLQLQQIIQAMTNNHGIFPVQDSCFF